MRHVTTTVAVAALCAGLAACGSSAKPAAVKQVERELQPTTPAPVGSLDHVNWALPNGEPTTLDYVKAGDYSPDAVISILCDNLLRLNPDFTISPGLAESYSNPDPRTLVYKLRGGVKFWDGRPLTADDVVASLKRNMDPKQEPVNGAFYVNVASIEKTGPLEVTIRFKRPDELFNKEMATVAGAVAEKAALDRLGKKFGTPTGGVMCTGPYELQKWSSGAGITVTANPHYWDPKLQPKVKTIDFKFLSDTSTLTSALASGDVDGAYEVPSSSIPALRKATSGKLYFGPSLQVLHIVGARKTGPMADVRIRKALNLALDRKSIVDGILNGAGRPNRTLISPTIWETTKAKAIYQAGYDKLPPLDKPDLAAARKLVQQAGSPKTPLVVAIGAGDEQGLRIATLLQATAQQIGLTMKIKQLSPTEFSNFFYVPSARAGTDLTITSGWVDVPDPLDYTALILEPGAIFNWIDYHNPQVTRDLAEARSSLNPEASARAFVRAQAQYTADNVDIPVANQYEVMFLNKRVTGAPASFSYIFSPWAAHLGAAN
jgi:peptide/nickel transport system substrate-binding protein